MLVHHSKGFDLGAKTALNRFRDRRPGVQIHSELVKNSKAALNYVTKEDTRKEGPWKNGFYERSVRTTKAEQK